MLREQYKHLVCGKDNFPCLAEHAPRAACRRLGGVVGAGPRGMGTVIILVPTATLPPSRCNSVSPIPDAHHPAQRPNWAKLLSIPIIPQHSQPRVEINPRHGLVRGCLCPGSCDGGGGMGIGGAAPPLE